MSQSALGQFCWTELATVSMEETKEFYQKVLGWQFFEQKIGDMSYTMIKKQDKEFAGMWQIPIEKQSQIPPQWLPYVLVEDIEETLEKAEAAGAKIVLSITKIETAGLLAVIEDPCGARLGFWQSMEC